MRARALPVFAIIVSLMAPSAWAQDEYELEAELRENSSDIRDARERLGSLGGSIGVAEDDLALLDAQLAALYAELAEHEASLAEAQAELDSARAVARAAGLRLQLETDRLNRARDARADQTELFRDRVQSLWKFGVTGYAESILNADDVNDAITQTYFVGRVLERDRTIIRDVRKSEIELNAQRAVVDRLHDQLRLQEATKRRATEAVASLTQVQRTLVGNVEVEQNRRQAVLDALRSDRRRYQSLIANLEEESRRIQRELAASRWKGGRPGKGELLWPTSGAPGSGYGYRTHPIHGGRRMHTGVDIGAPTGQEIVAAAAGLVVAADWRGGYGLAVVIDHGGDLATLYAHQSRLNVSEGDVVAPGQVIGFVGSTGYSTGPHLHFEVRVEGAPKDPMAWY